MCRAAALRSVRSSSPCGPETNRPENCQEKNSTYFQERVQNTVRLTRHGQLEIELAKLSLAIRRLVGFSRSLAERAEGGILDHVLMLAECERQRMIFRQAVGPNRIVRVAVMVTVQNLQKAQIDRIDAAIEAVQPPKTEEGRMQEVVCRNDRVVPEDEHHHGPQNS